jgi:hypothetical protein
MVAGVQALRPPTGEQQARLGPGLALVLAAPPGPVRRLRVELLLADRRSGRPPPHLSRAFEGRRGRGALTMWKVCTAPLTKRSAH